MTQDVFLADLVRRVAENEAIVLGELALASDAALAWRPKPGQWCALECLDHLDQTHAYYEPRIEAGLEPPVATREPGPVKHSVLGRVYMAFALNPAFSFPVGAEMAPGPVLSRAAVDAYLFRVAELKLLLETAAEVGISKVAVRIGKGARFNLADVLKVLVHHDRLHLDQARRALAAYEGNGQRL